MAGVSHNREETATVRKYLDFSKLIWTAKPYGNVLLHSLHIDSSYDVVFFLIPVGLALLSFVCCVYLMVSKLLASHVTSAVSIAGMVLVFVMHVVGVSHDSDGISGGSGHLSVASSFLHLAFSYVKSSVFTTDCVTLSKLRQHDIVSPNTTEYNRAFLSLSSLAVVDTFLLDQSTLARVPVYRQTIQLRATPLDASNRPAFSAMDQLRSFLEVVGSGKNSKKTLREDVETLVTTQRHRRDQIYSQLRERLLAVVGEKPIYKGTRGRKPVDSPQGWRNRARATSATLFLTEGVSSTCARRIRRPRRSWTTRSAIYGWRCVARRRPTKTCRSGTSGWRRRRPSWVV